MPLANQYPTLYKTLPKRAGLAGRLAPAGMASPAMPQPPEPQMNYGIGGLGYLPQPGDPYAGDGLRYGAQPQMGNGIGYASPRMRGRSYVGDLNTSAGLPVDQMNLPQGFAAKYPNSTAVLSASGYVHTPAPPPQGRVYADQLRGAQGTPGQGLMTNEQAQQFAGLSPKGYMPHLTVGGAYGQQSGERQRFNPMTGRYEGSQLGAGGYANPQAMAASQYQGATLRQGTSPSGQTRYGFYDGPPTTGTAGIGWDAAANAAVARNPALSRTATGGVAGSPNPNFAPPTMEELAANRAAYQAQRANTLASRQQGVTDNAMARADQRRVRQGNLTMEERMQAGIPGYAVAQQVGNTQKAVADIQAGAMRDAQQAQLGIADKQMGLQRELAQKQLDYQVAKDSGDRQAEAQARSDMAGLQRDLKQIDADMQGKALANSQQQWSDKFGLEKRGVESAEEMKKIALSEQYRKAAQEAANRGDMAEYNRLNSLATQLLPQGNAPAGLPAPDATAPSPGAATPTWASIPIDLRKQLQAVGPDQLPAAIADIFPGISRPDMDRLIQDMKRDSTASAYDPGGRGVENIVGGFTGLENWNRFILGNEKSPRMDFGYGIPILENIPRPVIPGPIGGIAAGFGW